MSTPTHLLPWRVLYEDDSVLAVEKPAGMVTHPAYHNLSGTLVDAVKAWCIERGLDSPWLVHRLDRVTSGIVLFARTEQAMRTLARQFERRVIRKRYIAAISGDLPAAEGVIDASLRRDPADRRRVVVSPDGQSAQTRFAVQVSEQGWQLVDLWPLTGRTHQLRAHLAHIGCPIVGDTSYGGAPADRVMLHAVELSFMAPGLDGEHRITVHCDPPADFIAHPASERDLSSPSGSFLVLTANGEIQRRDPADGADQDEDCERQHASELH